MFELSLAQKISVVFLPFLFALTLRESAHGWAAYKLGDPTAKLLGRVTLNPFKHIDPIGMVILPLLLMSIGGFMFGWAKPTPMTVENLSKPKRDMVFVALAGSLANLLMVVIWLVTAKFGKLIIPSLTDVGCLLLLMGQTGIFINVIIMVVNLLPLPGLDGSRILMSILPNQVGTFYSRLEPYSIFILIALLLLPPFPPGLLGYLISPLINFLIDILVNFGNI